MPFILTIRWLWPYSVLSCLLSCYTYLSCLQDVVGVLGELNVRDFSKFKVVGSANIWVADSKYELMEHTPSHTWVAAKGELLYGSDESAPIVAKVEKQCHAIVSPFVVAFYGVHFGGQDSDAERCRGGRCACCSFIQGIEGLRDPEEGCAKRKPAPIHSPCTDPAACATSW